MSKNSPELSIDHEIFKRNINQLYRTLIPMLIANAIFISILVWLYSTDRQLIQTTYWMVGFFLLLLFRAGSGYFYFRDPDSDSRPKFWYNIYITGTTLTATAWGLTGFLLLPYLSEEIVYVTIVIIVGIGSSAITSLGIDRRIYFFYIFPMSLLLALYLIIYRGGFTDIIMGFSLIPYTIFLTITSHYLSSNYNKSHRLQLENERLVKTLQEKIEEQSNLTEKLHQISTTDALTGIANRHVFEKDSHRRFKEYLRHQRPFSVIVIDLDEFKSINDQYGHKAGDQVLKSFSQNIQNTIRETDLFARVGGEEFCLLIDETDQTHTHEVASRIKDLVENLTIDIGKSEPLSITCSMGFSLVKEFDSTIDDAYVRADRALYIAKNNGRNRIEFLA